MKFISWNVNGFRACLEKGFADIFAELDADFFCLQETKMQPGQADFAPEGYHQFWNSAEKKESSRAMPPCRCSTVWAFPSMMERDEPSPLSMRTFISFAFTRQTPKGSWRDWSTAWPGKMLFGPICLNWMPRIR